MPFHSKAQRRLFYAKEAQGELPKGTAARWEEHTHSKKLPEKIKKGLDDLHSDPEEEKRLLDQAEPWGISHNSSDGNHELFYNPLDNKFWFHYNSNGPSPTTWHGLSLNDGKLDFDDFVNRQGPEMKQYYQSRKPIHEEVANDILNKHHFFSFNKIRNHAASKGKPVIKIDEMPGELQDYAQDRYGKDPNYDSVIYEPDIVNDITKKWMEHPKHGDSIPFDLQGHYLNNGGFPDMKKSESLQKNFPDNFDFSDYDWDPVTDLWHKAYEANHHHALNGDKHDEAEQMSEGEGAGNSDNLSGLHWEKAAHHSNLMDLMAHSFDNAHNSDHESLEVPEEEHEFFKNTHSPFLRAHAQQEVHQLNPPWLPASDEFNPHDYDHLTVNDAHNAVIDGLPHDHPMKQQMKGTVELLNMMDPSGKEGTKYLNENLPHALSGNHHLIKSESLEKGWVDESDPTTYNADLTDTSDFPQIKQQHQNLMRQHRDAASFHNIQMMQHKLAGNEQAAQHHQRLMSRHLNKQGSLGSVLDNAHLRGGETGGDPSGGSHSIPTPPREAFVGRPQGIKSHPADALLETSTEQSPIASKNKAFQGVDENDEGQMHALGYKDEAPLHSLVNPNKTWRTELLDRKRDQGGAGARRPDRNPGFKPFGKSEELSKALTAVQIATIEPILRQLKTDHTDAWHWHDVLMVARKWPSRGVSDDASVLQHSKEIMRHQAALKNLDKRFRQLGGGYLSTNPRHPDFEALLKATKKKASNNPKGFDPHPVDRKAPLGKCPHCLEKLEPIARMYLDTLQAPTPDDRPEETISEDHYILGKSEDLQKSSGIDNKRAKLNWVQSMVDTAHKHETAMWYHRNRAQDLSKHGFEGNEAYDKHLNEADRHQSLLNNIHSYIRGKVNVVNPPASTKEHPVGLGIRKASAIYDNFDQFHPDEADQFLPEDKDNWRYVPEHPLIKPHFDNYIDSLTNNPNYAFEGEREIWPLDPASVDNDWGNEIQERAASDGTHPRLPKNNTGKGYVAPQGDISTLKRSELQKGLRGMMLGAALAASAPQTSQAAEKKLVPNVGVWKGPKLDVTTRQPVTPEEQEAITNKIHTERKNSNDKYMQKLFENLHPDLQHLSYIESRYDHTVKHPTDSRGEDFTPFGHLGVVPSSAFYVFGKTGALKQKYPEYVDNHDAFAARLKKDIPFYNEMASNMWKKLVDTFGSKWAAYAWNHGATAAQKDLHENPDAADKSNYVKQFESMRDKKNLVKSTKG